MDFTPLVNYGLGFTVAPVSTSYLILYPIPDFDVGDAEFLIEDEEEANLFPERIVGEINLAFEQSASGHVGWCLMPMGVDYEALVVLQAYQSDWSHNSSEWANEKFWDRRAYFLESTIAAPVTVDHPYWTNVDIHPRSLLGSKRNLWPVLAVRNLHATVDLIVSHRLRGLWT